MFFLALSVNVSAQIDSLDVSGDLSLDSLLQMRISSVSKYEQTTAEAPASVTILAADDIQAYGYLDLMEALQAIRSVYLSYDRNYTYIGLRGFSRPTDYNNRLLFMIDGIPMNDNIWGGVACRQDYFAISMSQVERIELIRGASSALYGTSAMMGVINVVLKDGQTLDGGHVNVQGGSYGRKAISATYGKRTAAGLDFALGAMGGLTAGQKLYYPEFDTDSTLHGIADRLNGTRFGGLSANLRWKGFGFKAYTGANFARIPTGSYETIFGDNRASVSDRQSYAELSYTQDLGIKHRLSLRSNISEVFYLQTYPYPLADGGVQQLTTQGTWLSSELRYRWDLRANYRVTVGLVHQQHFQTDFMSFDERSVQAVSNFPYYTASAFLQNEWQPRKWLTIVAGGRFDRNYLGKQALTPRLCALLYPSDKTTIKAIYGRAFRAPNISELSADDGFSDRGNPDLNPEFLDNGELCVEQRLGKRFYATGSAFVYAVSGLIGRVNLNDSIDSFGNLTRGVCRGAELELIARLAPGNRFYASLSYQQLDSNANGGWMTNSPRWIYKGGGTIRALKHFTLAGEVVVESPRLTVQNTLTPIALLWNGNFAFKPGSPNSQGARRFFNHSTWTLRVYNILNWKNYVPGGFEHIQPAIQQNGRNATLSMNWNF